MRGITVTSKTTGNKRKTGKGNGKAKGTTRQPKGKGKGQSGALAAQDSAFRGTMDRLDHEFREMERRMETMFQDLPFDWSRLGPVFHGWSLAPGRFGTPIVERFGSLAHSLEQMAEGWRKPLMDYEVDEKNNIVTATCEIPGIKKDDIEVTVAGETIEIRADTEERRYHGKLSIGEELAAENAEADYDDGILRITVPIKREQKEKSRTVPVR